MSLSPQMHPVGRAARALLRLGAGRGEEIVRDGRRLDPEVQALLRLAGRVRSDDTAVEASRADMGRSVVFMPRSPSGVHVWERDLPGPAGPVRVRFYRDAEVGPGAPAICFFHGGGWVVGDLDSHHGPCGVLAQTSGAVVMSVHYRLAPEDPYPAAVEDAVAAYEWLVAHAGELGVDGERLAVMGDSAGGNLAALVALAVRDRSVQAPAVQALIYPATDFTMSLPSIDTFADGFLLTREAMHLYRHRYLSDEGEWRNPAASPLYADVAGVAPALVFTAGFDPLRDEGRAYAARLADAGVPVVDRCFDDLIHGFYNLAITRASVAAYTEVNRTVGAALRGELPALQR
ncbi:MAG: alpha/beta hydrolase [Microthrixaceae bacterium]